MKHQRLRRDMLHRLAAAWLAVCVGGTGTVCYAGDPGQAAGQAAADREWVGRVKALMQRGAYRDALEELGVVLARSPGDPLATAFRTLCEQRLKERASFESLDPDRLKALEQSKELERKARQRAAAQERALKQQMEQEQARWDKELERQQREAAKRENARRKQEQREAAARNRESRLQRRAPTPISSTEPTPPSRAQPAPAPAASAASSTSSSTAPAQPPPARSESSPPRSTESESPPSVKSQPSVPEATGGTAEPPAVELSPVQVATSPQPAPVSKEVASGEAVQMFADAMNVSPERQLATASGNVRVIFRGGSLMCDRFTLFTDTKDFYAQGHVRLEHGDSLFTGEMIQYNMDSKKGRIFSGSAASAPWYEHGRVVQHIAEGVVEATPGYLTSCEFDPPHYRLQSRRAIVFTQDRLARGRDVTLVVESLPLIYLPAMLIADRQSPFYILPGKKKPWEEYVLMGYRYEWPEGHQGTLKLDWRRAFGWGTGIDDHFDTERFGKGLVKLYYNEEQNIRRPKTELPKGAKQNRYRALFRHRWKPLPDTTVITDIQKYSDIDFRKELLFREEYLQEDTPESYVSMVTNDPHYNLRMLFKRRINRFQTTTEALPEAALEVNDQRIGQTQLYSSSSLGLANYNTKLAHSEEDTDAVRLDWFQRLRYGLNLFRPILVTPNVNIRQTYYNKDKQGSDRQGDRHIFAGQFGGGTDASLKLFRIFPVTTNVLGLDINGLRHVLTPTIAYTYVHPPTVQNTLLSFPSAVSTTNTMTIGLENKLQTKRSIGGGKPQSVDLARSLISVPYRYRGNGNKQGGRFDDWSIDVELYPWSWMRVETDWPYPSHFLKSSRDSRITKWNFDLVMVGGQGTPDAHKAAPMQAGRRLFHPGPQEGIPLLPQGQWYLGYGHRYSYNDKTESVVQFDWRLSEKWQISTFHRITWKEVAGGQKRFNNLREWQYVLSRDLHDWVGELVYRVDREYGEELFFTLTLKAYPGMPIDLHTSYHQPKVGSQSSPFSPIRAQTTSP